MLFIFRSFCGFISQFLWLATVAFATGVLQIALYCNLLYELNNDQTLLIIPLCAVIYAVDKSQWLRLLLVLIALFSIYQLMNNAYYAVESAENAPFLTHLAGYFPLWLTLASLVCFYLSLQKSERFYPLAWGMLLFSLWIDSTLRIGYLETWSSEPIPAIHSSTALIQILTANLFSLDVFYVGLTVAVVLSPTVIFLCLNKQYSKANTLPISVGLILFGLIFIGTSSLVFVFSLLLLAYFLQSRTLFIFSVFALTALLGGYYYSLAIPLLYKSLLLISCGGLFSLLAIYLYHRHNADNTPTEMNHKPISNKWQIIPALVSLFSTLSMANYAIYTNEDVLKNGQSVILALAPADPRSIMQGDYMDLNYQLVSEIQEQLGEQEQEHELRSHQGYAYLTVQPNNVATLCQFVLEEPLAQSNTKCAADRYLPVKIGPYTSINLPSHQYFFAEGKAEYYQQAKYGEYRVKNGKALLFRLLDEKLHAL